MRAPLLTGLLLLVLAPAASAATVSVSGGTLTVAAGSGERNRVTVSRSGTSLRVADRVTTRAGAGCRQSGGSVLCSATGLTDLVVTLGDQSDTLSVNRSIVLRGRLLGGSGDDTIAGGGGPDVIDGGSGRDTVSYASRVDPVNVTLAGGADDGAPGEGDDVVAIEVAHGGAGPDTLTGGAGADRLEGRGGDDQLDGAGGNDTLIGGTGHDAVSGGEGNDLLLASAGEDGRDVYLGGGGTDRVDYGPRTSGVVVDADGRPDDGHRGGGDLAATGLVPAIALLRSDEQDTVMPDVESLRGGSGDDVLAAGPSGGTIEGMSGTDVLVGGPGTDRLDGGRGFDRLLARDGRQDALSCGSEVDRVFADAFDRPPSDCERVSSSFAVGLAAITRTVAGGAVRVRVACPAQAAIRCVGAARVVTVRRVGGKVVTLGAARFNAAAGTSAEVTVPLGDAARATLARLGNATRVRIAARGRDEAGPARPAATRFILRG